MREVWSTDFVELSDGFRFDSFDGTPFAVRLEGLEFVLEGQDQEPRRFDLAGSERRLLQEVAGTIAEARGQLAEERASACGSIALL